MALTPEGTPYVESTDLVANYPAASLSLANRVDLVGVLPFADSAARATAIPSPTDGQYSYLQDTNATEFWNGSAWVSAGATPGLRYLNTTTFSAVSSVSVDSVFSATYDNYFINYYTDVAAGSPNLDLRLRVGGVDATGSNYTRQILAADGGATSAAKSTTTLWRINGISVDSIATGQINIFRPAIAAKTGYNSYGDGAAGSANLNLVTGSHSLSTAYDGFTLFPTSSTITGTLRVYGYRNS